jgi:hypothetical protein
MRDFAETMTMMAVLSDEEMSRPWKWRSEGLDLGVRDGYHRGLEAELGAAGHHRIGRRRR